MNRATDPVTRIKHLERKLATRKRRVAKTQAKLKDARQQAKHTAAGRTGS
jgi:hypothetical protein